ncbi:MAG: hypothetical protein EA379_11210 [Phycisphaerales bacterium]|nr:MAG: hypothetical protein EA379_11210 [Phycisphaerales bacterium]
MGSRTPIPEQTRSEPGPAFYGAAADAPPRVIFARVGTNAIAVEPWTRIEGRGDLHTLERARGRWLHEQGYTGGVRTHVNTHARREGRRGEAPPRAVIDVSESVEPERVARFSMPPGAAPRGPVRVLAADEGIDPAPSATLAVRE